MANSVWHRQGALAINDWPPLAWVVEVNVSSCTYRMWHGKLVEITDHWAVEGVWDGPFGEGSFDQSAQIYGSGIRIREDLITFVSPATTTERIWYTEGARTIVSNSLPALIAISGFQLMEEVPNYSALSAQTPESPIADATIPAEPTPIHVLAHHNLVVSAAGLKRVAKPGNAPFTTFKDYEDFLFKTANAIEMNARSRQRKHGIELLTTISSGYDSPAAAVIARHMGCDNAVTISDARSVLPRSDTGADVAFQLGLECTTYPRAGRGNKDEITFWAGLGNPQDEHFAVFEFPKPICLLFSGQYGGNIWALDNHFRSPFKRSDWSGLGFTEYRLWSSVIHCPVPFWGADRYEDILNITRSTAMKPWIRNGEYDRPIPRRLVEEAGVDPAAFGVRKSATQYDDVFLWPRRKSLSEDYRLYLKSAGISAPPLRLARILSAIYEKIVFPLEGRLRGRKIPRNIWSDSQRLLFVWANHRLAQRYRRSYHAE